MLRTHIHSIVLTISGFFCFLTSFSQINNENQVKQKAETNVQVQNSAVENSSTNTVNPVVNEPSRSAQTGYFYRQQTGNYRTAVQTKPNDAAAWANYYKTERYGNYTKTSNNINTGAQENLNEIVVEMEKNVPNSYEFNFIKYLNGNHDVTLFPYLQKAYELNPTSTELIDEFVAYYELTGNSAKKKEWCKKLSESKDIAKEVMEFDYNLIIALEKNAVLITHGEMDTYPLFIWQNVNNIRNDVMVLYLDLLEKDDYRNRKLQELGVTISANFHSSQAQFLAELAQKLSNRSVYFSSTVSTEILKALKGNLFLTGLAFKYSEEGFENVQEIANAWETKFKKEVVSKKVTSGTLASKINMNYVPGLILLAEYFRSQGLNDKAKLAEELAIKLAAEGGKEQQVKLLLNK